MLAKAIQTIDRQNNDTAAHASNLRSLSGSKSLTGRIGGVDQADYFRFKIGQRSSLNIALSQYRQPIKLQLLSVNQKIAQPKQGSDQHKKTIQAVLNPGTYLIRLRGADKTTGYQLRLAATLDDHSPLSKSSSSQYYKFKYSYGNGDYYTGYGYTQNDVYESGQTLFYPVTNETGLKGHYEITSAKNNVKAGRTNQVFVNYYYDSERKSGYKPYSGFGLDGLGSESGYLDPQDKRTYFGEKFYEADTPILLGVNSADYFGNQTVVDRQLTQLGKTSGKRLSMGALFMDIEDSNPGYNVPTQLNGLLNNGYTGFIQLVSHKKLADIINGSMDSALQNFAQAYAKWATQGNNRSTWIAPLPEMNGTWESYSGDPKSFKQAYRRIQQVFKSAGVPDNSVRWVFAPNGWSATSERSFEAFYPGADAVDAVGFSAFNWGYSEASGYKAWQTPTEVFDPFVQRMRAMAPEKPIFIAQTGTTSFAATGSNPQMKDQWLKDAYGYFAEAPGIRGVLYFNLNKETDWSLYDANGHLSNGYQAAVQSPAYDYISPVELAQTKLTPDSGVA